MKRKTPSETRNANKWRTVSYLRTHFPIPRRTRRSTPILRSSSYCRPYGRRVHKIGRVWVYIVDHWYRRRRVQARGTQETCLLPGFSSIAKHKTILY